ncbi:MAG: glycoside hydrolase family 28 protein [Bacteroidales bacterium]|nr:MAG: glycoside hydrolase family 28 protein [Bacteroidales bacterium]
MNQKRTIRVIIYTLIIFFTGIPIFASSYNVKTYGAAGNGKIVDSPAINKAIDAAAEAGGGTVYFPAGTYLCFSIRLKSHVGLYLDHGAVIVAANPTDHEGEYDPAEPNQWNMYQDHGHSHWQNSLIWGEGLEDISIAGPGKIYGKGLQRWDTEKTGEGNKAIALKNCRNVTISDITMQTCGHFCILPTGVDNFIIDNLRIDTNRDAINIDCCKNVSISNCVINTPNDDAIVLKSSYALGYPRITENVMITNCLVSGYDENTMLDGTFKKTQKQAPDGGGVTGRIKLGTESNGGFKNITITNCTFDHCRGLALETVDGGILEDITISNITMHDITNVPIFLRLGRRMRAPEGMAIGKMRRIIISNLIVNNANPEYGSLIVGIPDLFIEDVKLRNILILVKGCAPKEYMDIEVPELEEDYPDPRFFGKIPAYGFFIRHVNGIEFNNVEVRFMEEDFRPAFVLDDVQNAHFNNVKTQNSQDYPTFLLKNVKDFKTSQCNSVPDVNFESVEKKNF